MSRRSFVNERAAAGAMIGWLIAAAAAGSVPSGWSAARAQTRPMPLLANPASVNCVEKGGMLRIERRPDGAELGVCYFVDNYQCEEWALYRGECPAGGLRVTGYITPASRFCAITGGRYIVVANGGTADEKGICSLPGGKACPVDAYYAGTCTR